MPREGLGKIGIAHKLGLIKVSAPESFDRKVDRGGRAIPRLGEIVAFQNIQQFEQGRASGRWRGSADDLVSTIGSLHRFAFFDLVT